MMPCLVPCVVPQHLLLSSDLGMEEVVNDDDETRRRVVGPRMLRWVHPSFEDCQ